MNGRDGILAHDDIADSDLGRRCEDARHVWPLFQFLHEGVKGFPDLL
jgi:hypothetical protein